VALDQIVARLFDAPGCGFFDDFHPETRGAFLKIFHNVRFWPIATSGPETGVGRFRGKADSRKTSARAAFMSSRPNFQNRLLTNS
jgi:hypothetical protein